MTIPCCPKCKSTTFTLYVSDEFEQSARVENGVVVTAFDNSALPHRISAHGECACGHKWKFRNKWAIQ